MAEPVSVYVETFGTEHQDKEFISQYVCENYDLTPRGIIGNLHLLDVDYNKVSAYGHFGKQGVSESLTTADFTAAVLQGYFKKHRIFVISGYPLCKSRCLHNVLDFVTNCIVKRRFFTQKAIKTARFSYFTAFYVCGLGEARVDTKNRITSGELR